MKRTGWILVGTVAIAALVACGDNKSSSGATSATADPAKASAAPSTSASAAPSASAAAEPSASAAAEPSASAAAEPSASASAGAAAAPNPGGAAAPSASAAPKKAKYDCGGKGQKSCPMQGWMKGVMARAVASGDKDKIAKALNTIAAKPVPGMGQWSSIAAGGAAKAAAGDIDGAKASCKQCHSLYQKKYKDTRRDQPW